MNGMRKVFGFLLVAVMFAAFALPSFAGDNGKKRYSLDMAIVTAPPAAAPYVVNATITNEGNSTINSFRLSVTGLTVVGVNQPATGNATFTGSSVSVQGMHPLKSGDSLTVTIGVSSCGDGAWSASAWTGSSLNGSSFDLSSDDSSLATSISCGNVVSGAEFNVPNSINPDCVIGERGYYDKDGSVPVGALPFFVTNFTGGQLHFRWPDFQAGGDPLATFDYAVCASGPLPPPGTTKVAWLNADGSPASTPGTPAYITAQNCLENANFLPAPYGALMIGGLPADAGTGSTIPIDTTTPPPGPHGSIGYPGSPPTDPNHPGTSFDIVIGTERITVQVVCLDNDNDPTDSADCTETDEGEGEALAVVLRGVGGTTPAAHPMGALVMSTPLPLLPAQPAGSFYQTGHQALMCIQGRSNFPNDTSPTSHATTFIDIGGDGWGSQP